MIINLQLLHHVLCWLSDHFGTLACSFRYNILYISNWKCVSFPIIHIFKVGDHGWHLDQDQSWHPRCLPPSHHHWTTFQGQAIISKLCDQVSPPYDPASILVGGGSEGIPGKGETPIENLLEGVFGCWWLFREILFSWRLNSYQVSFLHCRFAFDAGAWKRWIPESLPDLPSPLPSHRCSLLVFWFTIYTYSIFLCQYLF